MPHRPIAALAAALTLGLAAPALAADATPPELQPGEIIGSGLNVIDLEGQMAWYQTMLGMTLAQTYSREGAPFEYILALKGPGGILALLKAPRPAGPNGFGRVILQAPDAKGLSAYLAAHGVTTREVIPGVAYFITDPEGNAIELFTPPKS
jgi:catechol-2,3-dioxygenase